MLALQLLGCAEDIVELAVADGTFQVRGAFMRHCHGLLVVFQLHGYSQRSAVVLTARWAAGTMTEQRLHIATLTCGMASSGGIKVFISSNVLHPTL